MKIKKKQISFDTGLLLNVKNGDLFINLSHIQCYFQWVFFLQINN